MISRNMASQFSIMLHNELDNAIDPLKQLLNKMDAVAQNQPGPISKWVGDLDINDPDDPRYEYLLAYGTSQKNFPAVVFKLGCSDQEACHLMAEVPIRVVVHIKLEKKAKPGASVVHNNDLTISVWVYDKSARQAKLIQKERLSTPGGQIRLWGSDFMTLEDTTLPEKYRRPYKNQYVLPLNRPPSPPSLPSTDISTQQGGIWPSEPIHQLRRHPGSHRGLRGPAHPARGCLH